MGMNAIEKILARHSDHAEVKPGDVVVVDVDLAVACDRVRPDIQRVFDPERIVLTFDHEIPSPSISAANHAQRLRTFAERFGIRHYFPVGAHGISHVLVAEEGLALPGMILCNADSHTCSSGALNALARGVGPADMAYVMCKGTTWYVVGPTTRVDLVGELGERVYARDVIHHLPGEYGDFAGRNLEWHGDGLARIGMDGRLTMATISAELSVEFSLFPYDAVLEEYVRGRAQFSFEPAHPDPDAKYERVITIDLSSLEPQVVLPDKVAWNVRSARDVAREGVHVDQAFVG